MTEQPLPLGMRLRRALTHRWGLLFAIVVTVGVVVRLQVLPSGGLFQDDAWVALTGTTSWGQAFKMAGTAPGFVALLHLWLPISSSPLWAVIPALIFGVLGLVSTAMVLTRLLSSAVLAWCGTLTLALSPVAVATSGHVKQYTLDFLIALWVTYVGVRALDGATKYLSLLVLVSLSGLFLSGSAVVVVLAVWLVLFVVGVRNRALRRKVFVAGGFFALGFLALFATFYASLPVALTRYWANYLLGPAPLSSWPSRFANVLRGLTTGFLPTTTAVPHEVLLASMLLICLVVLGAISKKPLPARKVATCTLVVAFLLAVWSKVPLGTGRTDMALYPALLILVLSGLSEVVERLRVMPSSIRRVAQAMAVLVASTFIVTGALVHHHYLNTPIRPALALAQQCSTDEKPTLVIDAYTRYPYALTTPKTVTEHFSRQYGAGFTVSVPLSEATIIPAQSYERPYEPVKWANQLADRLASTPRASRVIAYVTTPPGGVPRHVETPKIPSDVAQVDPFLAQLLRRGYTPTTLHLLSPILVTCLHQPLNSAL